VAPSLLKARNGRIPRVLSGFFNMENVLVPDVAGADPITAALEDDAALALARRGLMGGTISINGSECRPRALKGRADRRGVFGVLRAGTNDDGAAAAFAGAGAVALVCIPPEVLRIFPISSSTSLPLNTPALARHARRAAASVRNAS